MWLAFSKATSGDGSAFEIAGSASRHAESVSVESIVFRLRQNRINDHLQKTG